MKRNCPKTTPQQSQNPEKKGEKNFDYQAFGNTSGHVDSREREQAVGRIPLKTGFSISSNPAAWMRAF